MKKKTAGLTREELIRENENLKVRFEALRTSRLGSNVAATLRTLIKYVSICGAVVWSVSFLAGNTTKVDAVVDVCGNLKDVLAELVPAWWVQLVSIAVLALGWRSNARLRTVSAQQVKRISDLTKAAELASDPTRSSSGLGEDGETHERDRL